MTDMFDRASEVEEGFRADALRRQAQRSPRGESAKWCEGPACGERIPDERRAAIPGVRLCVDCQDLAEKRIKKR